MTSQAVGSRFGSRNTRTLLFGGVLALTLLSLILLAYFVHGGLHGLYADDFVYKYMAYDLAAGNWRPDWTFSIPRTLIYVLAPNLANALPDYELPVRLGIAALLVLDALLLGALAFRLTSSQLIALLSAAFFLTPVFASEAVLWFSGATIYLSSLLLLLVGFHLILSCHSFRRQFPLVVGAFAAWCAMVLFIESGFFIILLVPALVWLANERGKRPNLQPALLAVSATYVLFVAYGYVALRTAPVVANHGEMTFDLLYILLRRVPDTLAGLIAYARDWEPGGTFQEALSLGLREWLSTPAGWGVIGVALSGIVLTAGLYPPREAGAASAGRSAKLFLLGMMWIGLSLIPTLFFVNLQISSRVLLFPSAGVALGLAGLSGWVINRLDHWRGITAHLLVLMTGISVLVGSLTMAGLVTVYQLRWERDRQQLTALRTAIAGLPDSPVWVLPIALDERTVGPHLGHRTVLDQFLYGLFQVPWAAEPALRMEFGEEQLNVIDQDEHGQVHLTGLGYATGGKITSLTFEGLARTQEVPVTQLLAFTYVRNKLILFKQVAISMPDGAQSQVELPMAAFVASPQIETRTLNMKFEGDSP